MLIHVRRTGQRLSLLLLIVFVSACADSGSQQSMQLVGPSPNPSPASSTMGSAGDPTGSMPTRTAFVPATVANAGVFNPFALSSPRLAVQSQPVEGTVTFDGKSAASTAGELPASAAFSGVPSLLVTLDLEGRRVTLDWSKGPGDDPLSWRLYYQLPIGGGGFFDFLLGQTSVTADLPFGGLFTAEICAYNGGPYETGCVRSPIVPFTLPTLTSNVPNKPENFRGSANGSTVTFSWNAPLPGGGAPTTYILVYNGQELPPVGNVLSHSVQGVPPGRYFVAVLARNAAGSSAVATTEVTVGGTATSGNYTGSYSGTGSYFKSSNGCTWTPTYSGTITVILTQGSTGLVGSIRVTGTENVPLGSTATPNFTCLSSNTNYEDNRPVIISGTNIARTGLAIETSTGTFNGNLSGNAIVGTFTLAYTTGTGSIAMPVTLSRAP
jgi:hypothetical protein